MGMVVESASLEELFQDAASAMLDLILERKPAGNGQTLHISLQGSDHADLMVRWLGEILYLLQGEGLVATQVRIEEISSHSLRAAVNAVPFSPNAQEIRHEIKAVTYHESTVSCNRKGWSAKVIFDL